VATALSMQAVQHMGTALPVATIAVAEHTMRLVPAESAATRPGTRYRVDSAP